MVSGKRNNSETIARDYAGNGQMRIITAFARKLYVEKFGGSSCHA